MNTHRINAILNIANFDTFIKKVFSKSKGTKNVIKAECLAKIIFGSSKDSLSEAEASLLSEKDYYFSDLKNELVNVAKECLELANSSFTIKPSKYKEWRKVVLINGQDIFTCALKNDYYKTSHKYIIPLQSASLDMATKSGYAENHCHYNVAGPAFYYNWLFLHNGIPYDAPLLRLKKQKSKILKYYSECDYHSFYNMCALSIYLRHILYYFFYLKKRPNIPDLSKMELTLDSLKKDNPLFVKHMLDGVQNNPVSTHMKGNGIFDYCSSSNGDNQLFGERELLCKCFENYERSSQREQAVLMLYLIVRRHIEGFFVQNNMWFGFTNFKRFERIFDLLVPTDASSSSQINKWISSYLAEDPSIKKLEIRLAPKNNYASTIKRLKLCKQSFDDYRDLKVGLVLHFIKNSRKLNVGTTNGLNKVEPRSWNDILQYEKQLGVFKRVMLNDRKGDSIKLVGVDAANEEILCRPEIFAPFYRAIREYSSLLPETGPRIGYTFHVGEDFTFIVNGLRAIHEAIDFLELKSGDRLGHASALATNIDKYFVLKGKHFVSTKQDALDDYCYVYETIRQEMKFYDLSKKIKEEIENLLLEIYGSCNLDSYIRSISLRGDHPQVFDCLDENSTYRENEMRLRAEGKGFYLRTITSTVYQSAWKDKKAREYASEYHYSASVRQKGDEIFTGKVKDSYIDAIRFVQNELAEEIARIGIGIETNPSSNYLIGPYEDFEDIPAVSFDIGELSQHNIMVSIGTDDPGLFFTNLRNEYSSLYYHYTNDRNVKITEVIDRIEKLAKRSMQLSFVKD